MSNIESIYYPGIRKYVVIVNGCDCFYPANKIAMKQLVKSLEAQYGTSAIMKVSGE